MEAPKTIEWVGGAGGHLRLLDQTLLPTEVVYRDCRDLESVRAAIQELAVRGAPAIGVAAAYGLVLWRQAYPYELSIDAAVERLASSRPTAVNLAWALERMRQRWLWPESGPLPGRPQPPRRRFLARRLPARWRLLAGGGGGRRLRRDLGRLFRQRLAPARVPLVDGHPLDAVCERHA